MGCQLLILHPDIRYKFLYSLLINVFGRESSILVFVDLEKAFDRVPREVISWAMRKLELKSGLYQQ